MGQGLKEKSTLDLCIRNRQPIPDWITDAPMLQEGLGLYYSAFWELTTCRPIGQVEGPIPWTAVEMYCQSHELFGAQKADFHHHIAVMDHAYLDERAKKLKAKLEADKNKGPRSRRK